MCIRDSHKIADRLRLWALSVLCIHQNWRTSQALCTPMMKFADSLRLCAPPFTKFVTSQAVCTPVIKSPTVSGFGHFLCFPFTKSAGRLRLSAPPRMKSADSLRFCEPPSRELGDVSGSVHPHDEHCRQVSGSEHPPARKLGGRLRLFAPPS